MSVVMTAVAIGFLSAYALNPTMGTLAYRAENEQIPDDLSGYDVFLAVADCGRIGQEATLVIGGDEYAALVFDCAGEKDGGRDWMHRNAIVAEVDYHFWMEHPEYVGSGVKAKIIWSEHGN